jgi:hypothetical protein
LASVKIVVTGLRATHEFGTGVGVAVAGVAVAGVAVAGVGVAGPASTGVVNTSNTVVVSRMQSR